MPIAPEVDAFVCKFLNNFKKTETLEISFAKIVAGIHEKFIYNISLDHATRLELPDAAAIALENENAYRSVSDILTPLLYAKAVMRTFGRFLMDYGVLTLANASELSGKLTEAYVDAVSALGPSATGEECYNVLSDAGMGFACFFNILSPTTAPVMLTYFKEEMANLRSSTVD